MERKTDLVTYSLMERVGLAKKSTSEFGQGEDETGKR